MRSLLPLTMRLPALIRTLAAVTGFDASDGAPHATEFSALTTKVYVMPRVSPATVHESVVVMQLRPPGVDMTRYDVTGAVPESVGAFQLTFADRPVTTAETEVGAPGARDVDGGVGVGVGLGTGLGPGPAVAVGVGVGVGDADADGLGEAVGVGVGVGAGAEPSGTKVATALRAALIVTVHVVAAPEQEPVHPPKSAAGLGTASSVTVCVVG